MSTSRRSASGRGPGASSSGARRPRVAGLRNRSGQEPGGESTPPTEQPPTEQPPAESDTAEQSVAESDTAEQEHTAESEHTVESGAVPEEETGPSSATDQRSGANGASSTQQEGSPVAEPEPETGSETASGADAEAEADAEAGADAEAETDGKRPVRRATRRPAVLIAVMLVLTAGFGGLAFWFHSEAYSLRNEGPAANQALVDQAATSKVKGQITEAVETLFSYDFANTAKTEQAAKELLTGKAVQQYDKLFDTVREQAPKQKLVLTTTVRAAGVTQLQDDRAEVLLFVDQNATRTDTGQSNIGPAQLTVSAEKHGDQWKISGITPR